MRWIDTLRVAVAAASAFMCEWCNSYVIRWVILVRKKHWPQSEMEKCGEGGYIKMYAKRTMKSHWRCHLTCCCCCWVNFYFLWMELKSSCLLVHLAELTWEWAICLSDEQVTVRHESVSIERVGDEANDNGKSARLTRKMNKLMSWRKRRKHLNDGLGDNLLHSSLHCLCECVWLWLCV